MTVKTKALVFILDGLGDRPCQALGGQTPLQAAATPTLDRLAGRGLAGLMDPLGPGATVDTHTGVGILFGLAADDGARLRRGPVEAAGVGLAARPGDILLRANFACVEEVFGEAGGGDGGARRFRIIDRRAGRIRAGVDALCAALRGLEVGGDGGPFRHPRSPLSGGGDSITADIFPATQHRAVARLRGDGCALSAHITDTDPGGAAQARGVLASEARAAGDPAAQRTAAALGRLTARAFDILTAHPVNAARAADGLPAANGLIFRSAGEHAELRSSLTARGIKAAVVAGETTVLGLGKLLGFNAVTDARFTALPDTDLGAKLRVAVDALTSHDLVFVHIKGTDTAAHDRDPRLKSAFIAQFDRALARLDLRDAVIGVCADHATDSNTGEHNADPVPVLLVAPGDGVGGDGRARLTDCGRGNGGDGVGDGGSDGGDGAGAAAYNETACARGRLGRITAAAYIARVAAAIGA